MQTKVDQQRLFLALLLTQSLRQDEAPVLLVFPGSMSTKVLRMRYLGIGRLLSPTSGKKLDREEGYLGSRTSRVLL